MTFIKKLLLIVGKSGSGKTTLVNELEKRGYKSVESYTIRPERYPNERGHIFINQNKANSIKEINNIIAYTYFNGYEYFATKDQIDNADLYVIDKQGIQTLINKGYTNLRDIEVLYLNCPLWLRFYRMLKRGDKLIKIFSRIINDWWKFRGIKKLDDKIPFYIVNSKNNNMNKDEKMINVIETLFLNK